MYEILILLFDICLFRKGPEDMPYSKGLFKALLIGYAFVRALMLSMHFSTLTVLLHILVDIVFILGAIVLMLYLTQKMQRFCQVSSAVLGTDAIISFLALPGVATMEVHQGGLLVLLVTLSLIVWHWLVMGNIVSKSIEKPISFGLGLAFLYLYLIYQVMAKLFPGVSVY